MRKLLLPAAAGALLASTMLASAQTTTDPTLDPLHLCYTGGCTAFNGVTISSAPQPSGTDLSGFGISSSPAPETGTSLYLDLLIPQNVTEIALPTITGQDGGTPLALGGFSLVGTFGPGQDLSTVVGVPASPPNPYDAYTAATAALDPGFIPNTSDYLVYQVIYNASFTTGTTAGQTSALNNTFSLNGGQYTETGVGLTGPQAGVGDGAIFTAFLLGTPNGNLSTAQSSSLALDATPHVVVQAPEPSSLALLGGGLMMVGFLKRRQNNKRRDQSAA